MAAPKPRISCFVAEESRTIALATGCPAGIQAGASDLAWRWLPKVLHMRTADPLCAQA